MRTYCFWWIGREDLGNIVPHMWQRCELEGVCARADGDASIFNDCMRKVDGTFD